MEQVIVKLKKLVHTIFNNSTTDFGLFVPTHKQKLFAVSAPTYDLRIIS